MSVLITALARLAILAGIIALAVVLYTRYAPL